MTAIRRESTPTWRAYAACAGSDTHLFFSDDALVMAKARAICASCPVDVQCRREAIANGELGVWGGSSENDRRHSLYRHVLRQPVQ